jgi:hypothetical protein
MRGDLSETSAADACRDLAGDGATGVLWIDGPNGPGSVTFVEGRVVGATSPTPRARLGDRLVGAGFLEDQALSDALETQRASSGRSRLGALLVERTQVPRDAIRLFVQEQTLDAMFEVLRWRYGSFSFEGGEAAAVPEVPVAMTVDQALVEVARRQQQWRELSQVIPDLEAVPTFSSDPASAVASLEPDEFAVLASVDGDRSVRTLAADLGYGEFELARIVYGLVLLGVVEIELPEDEIGAALDDAMAYPGHDDPAPARPVRALSAVPDPEPDPDPAADADPDVAPEADVEVATDDLAVTGHGGAPERGTDPGADPAPAASALEAPADRAPDVTGSEDDLAPAVWESATAAEGSVMESELPERSYSDVFRELRGLEGEPPSAPPPPSSDPEPSTDEPVSEPPPEAELTPRRPARSADDGDVSEFLRELSRLTVDDQPAEPERPRRSPAPSSDPKDDGKRKRRGLFGRS